MQRYRIKELKFVTKTCNSFVFKENTLKDNKAMIYLIKICANSNIKYLQRFIAAVLPWSVLKFSDFISKGLFLKMKLNQAHYRFAPLLIYSHCFIINLNSILFEINWLHIISFIKMKKKMKIEYFVSVAIFRAPVTFSAFYF